MPKTAVSIQSTKSHYQPDAILESNLDPDLNKSINDVLEARELIKLSVLKGNCILRY